VACREPYIMPLVVRELHSQANCIEVVAAARNKEKAEVPIARHVFQGNVNYPWMDSVK
jgi:hypothetical protein